jgi:MYXO-CTERM domain-containing protein
VPPSNLPLRRFLALPLACTCLAGLTASSAIAAPGAATSDPGSDLLFGRERPVAGDPAAAEASFAANRAAIQAAIDAGELVWSGNVLAPPSHFDETPLNDIQADYMPDGRAPEDWPYEPHRATIFLNFFGGELKPGSNSARMESSCVRGAAVDYPAFRGSESQALALIQFFEAGLDRYGVRVAYEEAPPPELPYAMVMMGGRPSIVGLPSGVLGVSCSADCGDRYWRDTTLAFTEGANNPTTLAQIALHEAAHAWGLAHIDGAGNIMYPYAAGGEVWPENCVPYNAATGGINCQSTHDIFCGGGSQWDAAELTAYFGEDSPDLEAPTVTIVTPADGTELPEGSNLAIEAEIVDNFEGAGWRLVLAKDGVVVQEAPSLDGERSWSLSNLPSGVYDITVRAIDHDRNVGEETVRVYVGQEAPPNPTTTGGGSGGGGTDSDGSSGTGSSGGGSGTSGDTSGSTTSAGASGGTTAADTEGVPGLDSAEDDAGCACATAPAGGTGLGLAAWLLALPFAVRRRRQAAA